ncbi:MAG: hypothetical protein K8I27_03090 [Planctomycetes bacterium]|nr:hypothetical protein [Planctomycetota bacterium]
MMQSTRLEVAGVIKIDHRAGHILGVLLLGILMLGGCAGTSGPRDELLPPGATRQGELTRLYDQMGSESDSVGVSAAQRAAEGDDRDRRFMASLWGTRRQSAMGARRYGQALSDKGHHQSAFDWFQRAFLHLEADHELLPWLRYEMAYEYYLLGRNEDAVNLLVNRMSTTPLPRKLRWKYDELIRKASS